MTLMMKLKWMAVAAAGVGLLAAQVSAEDAPVLKTEKDRASYAIGVDMARNMKRQRLGIEADALVNGMRDGFAGASFLMGEEDMRSALSAFQSEMKLKRAQAVKATAEENRKEGEAFLAENKAKEGVVTLPSGLQYKVMREGEGRKPVEGDTVECNYKGSLIDGTEFDSSYRAGKSVAFEVKKAGVIPGWNEALKLMSEGSKWQLFIPQQLAYGERGAGPYIGPNSTLIFEVELLAVKSADAASQNK